MHSEKLNLLDFKRKLEEIAKYEGRGTELISLYIPPHRPISDVMAYLRQELSQSSNIKSKSTRKNVMNAIEMIMARLKYYRVPPPHGLVFFVGHVPKPGGQYEEVVEIIEPPEPVPSFIYRCDSKFYLEPLLDMLRERDVYGIITIDRSEATFALLKGKRVYILKHLSSDVPSKHHQGGQSARRFERIIELAALEFYQKVAETAKELFLPMIDELKGIFVGGPGPTKEEFLKRELLDYRIRDKILHVFDVGYADEQGVREVLEKATQVRKDMELAKERKLVREFLKQALSPSGGRVLYGLKEVIQGLLEGSVGSVLVSEKLEKRVAVYRCPRCGREDIEPLEGEPQPRKCPSCGSEMEVEVKDALRFIIELAEAVSAEVHLISTDTEEGQMLLNAFGGIAAFLRW
ncbi:MAG: peptide chain release factor 1 [Thermoplasmata archaeon]|nr:MAG: peptide chain release factor 1 [Thermoplasmata archaeon]